MLQAQIPGTFITKCVCQSFHLCTSYAWQGTTTRSGGSGTRCVQLLFVSQADVCPSGVPKACRGKVTQSLGLLLQVVVTCLLDQMPASILFFKKAATEDCVLAAEALLEKLSNPFTKLHLEFPEYMLPFFTNLNKEMQSEKTRIHHRSHLFQRVF